MIVLSLFDGISCGKVALDRAGIKVDKYYASEIDKYAIQISEKNHKGIIRLGDATKWKDWDIDFSEIDLVIGGSPCQDFSMLKAFTEDGISGLKGSKSSLFYTYLSILRHIKSLNHEVKFLLENVKMSNANKALLDEYLNVKGIEINSRLLSYQNRPRIYWANFDFFIPDDQKISFQDYKETDYQKQLSVKVKKTPSRERMWSEGLGRAVKHACDNITHSDKIMCLTTKQDRFPNSGLIEFDDFCRYLTVNEMEQAQTLTKGYTDGVSYGRACHALGNAWTVDVIAHIFRCMIKEQK